MKTPLLKKAVLLILFASVFLGPDISEAGMTFNRIVVFGTSLSDTGNAFSFIRTMTLPPYDTLDQFLVPSAPYGKRGHHFSNGATWIEYLARTLGLAGNARPAFQNRGDAASNYAVGGARAREGGTNRLSAQVGQFLLDNGGTAPADALYIIEMGANDIRDALATSDVSIIGAAVSAIGDNIRTLYSAGARKFLVWNAPDIGLTPAVGILERFIPGAREFTGFLSRTFNLGLDAVLADIKSEYPDMEIRKLDAYDLLNRLVHNPGDYGLSVVDKACVMPFVPPFECQRPDEYLFWDGIHPTSAVNSLIAQEAASALN